MFVMTTHRSGMLIKNETHVQFSLCMGFLHIYPPNHCKGAF